MDIRYRGLAVALFIYEIIRLLLLVVFLFLLPQEYSGRAFFPNFVYLSANALFPLMTLFVWLNTAEYRNYIPLYMAGKIITVVSFFAWQFLSPREFPGMDSIMVTIILWGGSIFINLTDTLSVGGAWLLKNRIRRVIAAGSGGA